MTTLTPEAHSKFSASASARWLACPGSMVLSKGLKDSGSKYARWGTAAHDLAAMALTESRPAAAYLGRRIAADHETLEVDPEMVNCVQPYLDLVTDLRDKLGATLLVEQRLDYGSYLDADGQGWGTGDAVLVTADEIIVVDLKTGRGEVVEAEDNTQLQLYALGALAKFGEYADFTSARVIICQPRVAGGTTEWTTAVQDLLAFGEQAKKAVVSVGRAEACAEQDAEWEAIFLNPGEKQCRWCKAAPTCPALRDVVSKTVFQAVPATVDEFDACVPNMLDEAAGMAPTEIADWLAAAMKKADLVETWLKAVRGEVERRMLAGETIDGFKLVQGRQGARNWTDEAAAEKLVRETFRLPVDDAYDKKLKSPTQMEKVLKDQPKRWQKLNSFIGRADGKISVAPATDKRPAVQVTPVVDDFADQSGSVENDFA